MSNLDIWNNPMHSMELRLVVAIAEITKLREQLATVTKERDELLHVLDEAVQDNYGWVALANKALAKVGADTTGETK